jgi:hypothetical protein
MTTQERTKVSLKSPGALAASLPYLLGFQPHDDLVAVWIKDNSILVTQRADLEPALTNPRVFFAPLMDKDPDEVVLVVYGEITLEQSLALVKEASEVAHVKDVMWVRNDRWASMLCEDLRCCPKDGRPIELGDGAEFVAEGVAPYEDRQTLVASLQPAGKVRLKPCPKQGLEAYRDDALTKFSLADPKPVELREMSRSLHDIRVRDTLLWEASQTSYDLDRLYERLCEILRVTHPMDAAPVATTTALVAWQRGDGAAANVACDFAEQADENYSLMQLVRLSLASALPPSNWTEAMRGLTRDDCRYGTGGSK